MKKEMGIGRQSYIIQLGIQGYGIYSAVNLHAAQEMIHILHTNEGS